MNGLLHFNEDKCVHMITSNGKSNRGKKSCEIYDKQLETVGEEEDLEVIIDSKLSFDSHIFAKVKKAESINAVFKKTFIKMTIPVLLNIYKGLIRPQLEFCNQAWYTRLKKNTRLMENVQRRATRMVQGLQTLSYNERLKKPDLPSHEYCRRRGTLIEMFKIGYNRYEPNATKYMFELNNRGIRTNDKKAITKKANFELRKNFFLSLDQLQIGTYCQEK